jgi:hypothetical protein
VPLWQAGVAFATVVEQVVQLAPQWFGSVFVLNAHGVVPPHVAKGAVHA